MILFFSSGLNCFDVQQLYFLLLYVAPSLGCHFTLLTIEYFYFPVPRYIYF